MPVFKNLSIFFHNYNQGPDDECPSAADFPICCPCVQAGPTAKYMALRDGLNLVVAPSSVGEGVEIHSRTAPIAEYDPASRTRYSDRGHPDGQGISAP
jgi:hypothetical protein